MTKDFFDSREWLKAMHVRERAQGLESLRVPESGSDSERAHRRLQRWRSQSPFSDGDYFARRLEADHLTETGLLFLLGETTESLGERFPAKPEWLVEFERGFSDTVANPDRGQSPKSEIIEHLPSDGFLRGIAPLIEQGLNRIRIGLASLEEAYPFLPFNPATVTGLFLPSLLMSLANQASRVMVLELNVARLRGDLLGDTSAERFNHFNYLMAQPRHLLPLLLEYPVLARQLVMTIQYWARNCLEVLGHLCADWADIIATLSPAGDPGPLTAVAGDAGDTHRQGRSVKILSFRDGLQIVYKPHSLGIDVHFNELLEWLNQQGARPALRSLKVLDRSTYGWVEFVKSGGCETPQQVHSFYQRQGGLLALLYTLEATDFHFENLIAAGEHPVLVDLESLFQHRPSMPAGAEDETLPASNAFAHSVMRIGLLPQRTWTVDQSLGVDMSGLAGAGGQLTPFPVLMIENAATDELKLVRKRLPMPGFSNLPSLEGGGINLQDYTADVIAGFTSVYRLLLKEREHLLAPGGLLARFGEDEVRVILRATQTYMTILGESYHPDVLRDALDRDRLFDRLWEGAKLNSKLCAAIPAEIRDLQNGDIPIFSSRPNSRDLLASDGQQTDNFFKDTSLETVMSRVRQLSEDDLARQVWLITASISSLSLGTAPVVVYEPTTEAEAGNVNRAQLLAAAGAVADRLGTLAIRSESNVNWIGLSFIGQRQWTLMPLLPELYNGTLGVALFLAYAGEVLGEERHTTLARLALDGIVQQLGAVKKEAESAGLEIGLGGYNGLGSIVYTMAHAGTLWHKPEYFAAAESLLEYLPRLIEKDETFDIIGGSAGCILNLLAFHQATDSEAALVNARMCADHILAHARTLERGVIWNSKLPASHPLTGFSHGNAGIAHALIELAAVTGDVEYERCALKAFEYERSVFSPERRNWPDYRQEKDETPAIGDEVPYMTTWCHGAVGIGFSRLRAMGHLADGELRSEVAVAVQTTLAEGFGQSHSLCHGAIGNLEFLFEAGRELKDEELLGRAGRKLAAILLDVEKHGWLCGTPQGTETPGLMTGLAGIGYGLLRIAEPDSVPSALMLGQPLMSALEISGQRSAVAIG